jgi:hypothetical protein
MNDKPDFMTDMRTYAIALHELYRSYIDAGFTKAQAFELTQTVLAESIAVQNNTPTD